MAILHATLGALLKVDSKCLSRLVALLLEHFEDLTYQEQNFVSDLRTGTAAKKSGAWLDARFALLGSETSAVFKHVIDICTPKVSEIREIQARRMQLGVRAKQRGLTE